MASSSIKAKKYTFALYAGAFIFCLCINITGPFLSDIMTDYDIALQDGGIMTFCQYLGGIAAVLLLSKAVDRSIKPLTLIISSAIAAGMLFFIGSFLPFNMFIILYLIFGASLGIVDTVNSAVLADLYPAKTSIMLLIFHGVCCIGAASVPVISALLGASSWKSIYRSVALIMAAVIAVQLATYFSERKSIDSVYINRAKKSAAIPFKKFFSDKNVWFIAFATLFYGMAQNGITIWVVKYCQDVYPDAGAFLHAFILVSFWIGMTISRLAIGLIPFFKKISQNRIIIIGNIFAGIALFAGVILGSYQSFFIGVFLFGILIGTTIPLMISLLTGMYPQNTGLSSGVIFASQYVGFCLISMLMGIVAAAFGMTSMIMLPIISSILCGVSIIPYKYVR